jgi:hypothetical protein
MWHDPHHPLSQSAADVPLALTGCCRAVLQGSISFPIFVLHGALGQLFYKKIVATKVRPMGMSTCHRKECPPTWRR